MGDNIKLLCLDLDGTTLKDVCNIPEKNIEYIRKAYERGIKIALVSGRLFIHVVYFSKVLGIPTYIIGNNGTYVYDLEKEKLIYSSFLGVDNLVKIHNFVKEKPFNVHYSTIDTIYSNNKTEDYHNEEDKKEYAMKEFVIKDDETWDKIFKNHGPKVSKVVASSKDSQKLSSLIEEIRQIGDFEIEYSWINTIEILNKGEGKGRGLVELKNYLGLDTSNVMCIGDSGNDLSMFRESGYKVAMGNAIEDLKEKADFITLKNDENGVAYAIEKLLQYF